jgi:hypothetical protein
MDKIYTAEDIKIVIAKVKELAIIDADLQYLLAHGSNDEKLVERKRELESLVRSFRGVVSNIDTNVSEELEDEAGLAYLKVVHNVLVSRYKERKRELENIIKSYTDGNVN